MPTNELSGGAYRTDNLINEIMAKSVQTLSLDQSISFLCTIVVKKIVIVPVLAVLLDKNKTR